METKNFKTIFLPYKDKAGKAVEIIKIEIPKIQRDYAYGRTDEKNKRKRDRFLDSLFKAVNGDPITLDFIYGDIKDKVLTPLDGQQRLTTLYLLYWYASKKEKISDKDTNNDKQTGFLKCFSYETRPSARKFCEYITTKDFELKGDTPLSSQIKDKNWFPLEWQHDATISSMLVMLDAIQVKFASVDNLFSKLDKITFYFLPIKNMGLTDELYIKMNSRGKPLTQFEHFKAEFEKQIKLADENLAKQIGSKIDREWTDLLWQYRNSGIGDDSDNTTDDEFLRYFIFICNVICYKNGGSPKTFDEFDLINDYFTINGDNDKDNVIKNVKTLERFFDCWLDDKRKSIHIQDFFESFVSKDHSDGKIKTNYNVNFLEDCLKNYADIIGKNRRKFTLNQIILLYAFIIYLQNKTIVSKNDFSRRLRIINNLVLNSSDQISDSEDRQGGNRLPAILKQVDSIVLKGRIADSSDIGNNFNPTQLEEEKTKLEWTNNNPDKAEMLFALEDNELLYGQVSIVGLEQPEHFKRFETLFNCNWDMIDCALFTIGDYKQKERNGWRYQLGSSMKDGFAWKALFHKSENLNGFENTKKILSILLSQKSDITNDYLESMVKDYLKECENKSEYPWIYYYLKYNEFRTKRYGKYWWNNFDLSPYVLTTLYQSKQPSENSYNPFLKAVNINVSRKHWGTRIYFNENEFLRETQSSYQIVTNDDIVLKEYPIDQNVNGIDSENRIEKMKKIF